MDSTDHAGNKGCCGQFSTDLPRSSSSRTQSRISFQGENTGTRLGDPGAIIQRRPPQFHFRAATAPVLWSLGMFLGFGRCRQGTGSGVLPRPNSRESIQGGQVKERRGLKRSFLDIYQKWISPPWVAYVRVGLGYTAPGKHCRGPTNYSASNHNIMDHQTFALEIEYASIQRCIILRLRFEYL